MERNVNTPQIIQTFLLVDQAKTKQEEPARANETAFAGQPKTTPKNVSLALYK